MILDLFSDQEKKIFLKNLKLVRFKAGDKIIQEGELGRSMYIFKSGKVKITRKLTLRIGGQLGESEKAFAVLGPDKVGFFGEMSLLTGLPRSATIVAVTDCELYELTPEGLARIANTLPEAAYKFIYEIAKVLAERVGKLDNTVLKLTTALSLIASKKD